MKLYDSVGPNPAMVRMFIAEKGVDVDDETIDIRGGVNREADYLKINPRGTCPALVLEDGSILSEITAICEYLEDTHPDPVMIGKTPAEKAETRMWTRRIDLGICEPMANGFRFGEGLAMFENRIRCIPEASDGLKAIARDNLTWLDGEMAGKSYIAGERFTLADVLLFSFLSFAKQIGQELDSANANLTAWFDRVGERPSAGA